MNCLCEASLKFFRGEIVGVSAALLKRQELPLHSLRRIPALLLIAFTLTTTGAAAQEQVRFRGTTSADEQLRHDAFQNIVLYVRNSLKCDTIEEVAAEVLPDGAIKRDAAEPEGTGPATYELWTVTFCGKKRPFLVVFWEAKDGGTMYRIQLSPAAHS
jgi:hypothetical protein